MTRHGAIVPEVHDPRRHDPGLALATVAAGLILAFVPAPPFPVPVPAPMPAAIPAPVPPAPPVPPTRGPVPPAPVDPGDFVPFGVTVAPVPAVFGPATPVAGSADLEVQMPIVGGVSVVSRSTAIATPFLTAWTMALLVIRLRRPHAAGRRLTRQPGLAACGAGVTVLVAIVAAGLVRWAAEWLWEAIVPSTPAAAMYGALYPTRPPLADLWYVVHSGFAAGTASIGDAIAATWLIMALGGWWRPEKSGIDRLGRALGAAWLALIVAGYIDGFLG